MDLSGWIGRLAAGGPVPLFAVAGGGAREAVQDLRLRPDLALLDTPASASILLVAGRIPEAWAAPLARIHDTMAHPRATLVWTPRPGSSPALPGFDAVAVEGDPVTAARTVYRDLVTGRRRSEAAILPDADPAPWRGVGPYGQGGTGMTGGVPYGRPMAELGADPDGLRLDVLPVTIGPFFPRFPAGLVLAVRLAGDLVLEASLPSNVLDRPAVRDAEATPFLRALDEPVLIAELELARARAHLRWFADALQAHGLPALGLRALRLATTLRAADARRVAAFAGLVRRSQVGRWATGGVGRLGPDDVRGLALGPISRAAGVGEDARLDDPAYAALSFAPVVVREGDARARWQVRLAEAEQSLELASRAAERRTAVVGQVESPRGRLDRGSAPAERVLALVPGLLQETEWGDAVTTVVSLDLDLDAAVPAPVDHVPAVA